MPGCGFGDTAIQLARLVGPAGSVLAVDCCDGFLAYGREDAKAAGISNITFLEADVQAYPFQPVHDFCFSRFGTQFFENPVAGLRNMRATLKPGGVMTMVVWRGIKDNPWLGHAKDVVLKYLPPPGDNALTCGPGPFSMADTGVVTRQLEIAGYKDIRFEQVDAELFVGKDVDDAVAFQLALGPAGEVYREAGELAEKRHGEIACGTQGRTCQVPAPEWNSEGFKFMESVGAQSRIMSGHVIRRPVRLLARNLNFDLHARIGQCRHKHGGRRANFAEKFLQYGPAGREILRLRQNIVNPDNVLQPKSRLLHGGLDIQKGLLGLGRHVCGNLHGGVIETRGAGNEDPVAVHHGAGIGHFRFKFRARGNELSGHAVFSMSVKLRGGVRKGRPIPACEPACIPPCHASQCFAGQGRFQRKA